MRNKFPDGNRINRADFLLCRTLLVLIVIHSIGHFNIGIFTSLNEPARYRILVLLWVYFRIDTTSCLCIPVEVSIFDYQDNRSIVSAFARSYVRGYIPFINDVIDIIAVR